MTIDALMTIFNKYFKKSVRNLCFALQDAKGFNCEHQYRIFQYSGKFALIRYMLLPSLFFKLPGHCMLAN